MLDIMAQHLTDVIYKYCELEPAKRSVYTYGFQLSLSTLGSMTSIFMMALAFGNLYSAVAFLGVFFVLRIFSGGYHAPTYARCFVLTNGIYLIIYGLDLLVEYTRVYGWIPFSIMISTCVVLKLAPIQNSNHPISEFVLKKNKQVSRTLVILQASSLLILYFSNIGRPYLAVPALSMVAVAGMMVLAFCEGREKLWRFC